MRKPPIEGGFYVLVVPKSDVEQRDCTVPSTFHACQPTEIIRAVAQAEGRDVGCSPWAFTNKSRKAVVNRLRRLADWIENHPIPDTE
jgi:hypothetical protein